MWEWLRWLLGKPQSAYSELAERESAISLQSNFYYLSLNYENDKWSIHGLWPQNSASSYPQYCRTVTFDPSLLTPIRPQLQENWASDRGSDDTFWQHEWEKHGSCMFDKCDEFEYFSRVLNLFSFVCRGNLISKYTTSQTTAMVPFDLNFNLLPPS